MLHVFKALRLTRKALLDLGDRSPEDSRQLSLISAKALLEVIFQNQNLSFYKKCYNIDYQTFYANFEICKNEN